MDKRKRYLDYLEPNQNVDAIPETTLKVSVSIKISNG